MHLQNLTSTILPAELQRHNLALIMPNEKIRIHLYITYIVILSTLEPTYYFTRHRHIYRYLRQRIDD